MQKSLWLLLWSMLLVIMVSACAPVYSSDDPNLTPLPTIAPTPLPDEYDLNGAEDVARRFLEAWQTQDYPTMHSLISFAARDTTPLEAFEALYDDIALDITLQNVSHVPLALTREQPNVAVLTYNLTFETLVVGTFTDENRSMRLTIDPVDRDWRVAWTAGDIFAELAAGGALRIERQIPRRANIYDRNGTVLADQNGRMVRVLLVQANMPNPTACINGLAAAFDESTDEVQATLIRFGDTWLADVGLLEPSAYLEYEAQLARDCAAEFEAMNTRRYPNGTLMPHIIGYVGYPTEAEIPAVRAEGFTQESILGRTGIERTWDQTLRGGVGGRLSIVIGQEVARIVAESPPTPPQSVWLTLDAGLQAHVQEVLATTYRNAAEGWAPRSRGAAAVVLDVRTGEVLAMVSYPTYDANAFVPFPEIGRAAADAVVANVQDDPRKPQLNRATMGGYPAGSTMKIATTLAAVDSGTYAPDEQYMCIGSWSREPNFVRSDWLPNGHGLVTVRTALAQSCNPFFYEAGYQMDMRDRDLLPDYMYQFGLGVPTGLRDVAENPGLIANADFVRTNYGLDWTFSRSVNLAIGQDMDITPLQITRLSALVATEGIMYRPQMVLKAGLIGEAPSYELQPEILDTIDIDDEAWAVVKRGMCDVTQERYGTAEFQFRNSRVMQYRVCGKTGTAESPGIDTLPHAWFTAYAPMENPEIAVAVIVENSGEGSAVAAPIVRDIMDYYFFEYDGRNGD